VYYTKQYEITTNASEDDIKHLTTRAYMTSFTYVHWHFTR